VRGLRRLLGGRGGRHGDGCGRRGWVCGGGGGVAVRLRCVQTAGVRYVCRGRGGRGPGLLAV
jgi:hypothetical protein